LRKANGGFQCKLSFTPRPLKVVTWSFSTAPPISVKLDCL
jgi:hypothetical protein